MAVLAVNAAGVCVRRAVLGDRDAILGDLSEDIYGGHDYLAMVLDKWLWDEQGHHLFVAEAVAHAETHTADCTALVLGFSAVSLLDDGITAVFQALRVHPESRGKGVASLLTSTLIRFVEEQLPGVRRLRVSTAHHNGASLTLHKREGYEIISRQAYSMASKPTSMNLSSLTSEPAVERVSVDALYALYAALSSAKQKALLPRGAIILNWEPYDMTLANLRHLQRDEGMGAFAMCDPDGEMIGFALTLKSSRVSGIHAFMDVRAGGCASTFQSLAFEVVRTSTHGCSAVCVVYDVALRADLTPQPADEEDARVPPAVVELGLRLPELDWSVDYVRGDTMLLERNLIEGSN